MPKPLRGLVAVAEFGSILEAEAVARELGDAGIDAIISHDPALNSALPYLASERVVEVIVREEDFERAQAFLAAPRSGLPAEFSSPEVDAWRAARGF